MRVVCLLCVLVLVGGAFADWRPRGSAESQTDQELFDKVFESLLTQYGRDAVESKAMVAYEFCDIYTRLRNIEDRVERHFEQSRLDELRKELDQAARNPSINVYDIRQSVLDALAGEYGRDVVDKKSTLVQEYVDTYVEMQKLERYQTRFNHRQRLDALRFKLSK
jgi:hypothetical protein